MIGNAIQVNQLDRLLAFFEATHSRRIIGETYYQGDDMPQVFFVDSAIGSDSNDGRDPRTPYDTLNEAFDHVSANRGDVVFVMPGHVETVTAAGGLTLDIAGVTIVGLGVGDSRPQINFTTAVGASMVVSAANIHMENFLFTGGIDALTNPIHIQAAGFELHDFVTRDVTGQATDFILTTDAADRLWIKNWQHQGAAAAGADTAISIVGTDDIVVEDFEIYGNFAVAAIEQVTTAGNRHRYGGGERTCFIWTENAADVAITLKSDTTGHIAGPINIMLQDNAANITEALVGAAAQFFQPLRLVNLAGESSMETNITASTDA